MRRAARDGGGGTPPHLHRRGYPVKAATWAKWDLHVHTPASVVQHYGDAQQSEVWEQYIAALEALPEEIKVVGINDYFTVEGYRRVRAAKAAGRLANLHLILPAVELRLTSFAGHTDLKKLNFHVVFSDELSPDEIEEFFLREMRVELRLDGTAEWRGTVGTKAGLDSLGEAVRAATPAHKRTHDSATRVGFRSAAVELPRVLAALEQSVFAGKYLTAIGVAEWDQMRWDGAGAAQKRDAIERAHFVLTAAPSPAQYQQRRERLRRDGVNDRLVHASDAHHFVTSDQPNRLGQTSCWVKADLTFRGLQRALIRFDERVFVGDRPPKLERVARQQTKYIQSVEIRRRDGSKLDEVWFDVKLDLSPDLVAIIGNQGQGKSALTDVLGLCGNSTGNGFSFLTSGKFCDKKRKAAEFVARLTWADGVTTEHSLMPAVDETQVERVRYVPQGFFEAVTNETTVSEGGSFYGEVKKAIFSHVPGDDRLGCTCLDDLIERHTSAAADGLVQLRQQLSELNGRIVALEGACSPAAVQRLEAEIAQKQGAVNALRAAPPPPVAAPEEDAAVHAEMERLRTAEAELAEQIQAAETDRAGAKQAQTAIRQASESLDNIVTRVRAAVQGVQRNLTAAGVAVDITDSVAVTRDAAALDAALAAATDAISAASARLDPEDVGSLVGRAAALAREREALAGRLEAAASAYEAYRSRHAAWEQELAAAAGDGPLPAPDSLRGLQARLTDVRVTRPAALEQLRGERRDKCREVYRALRRVAGVFRELTEPVQAHIARETLTRDRYRLTFDVALTARDFPEQLFNLVKENVGTFAGQPPGRERVRQEVDASDFDSADGAVAFAERILDQLQRNHKHTPPTPVDVASLVRRGMGARDVYDLLFGLEYLSPTFALTLNDKPLELLSPGERGILLLVFYLVVDKGDEPLIIDQPEGNLNNQSIVEHLVPVFVRAKERRQVIMVTHNPNLAVVCDAEQIVYCELDVPGGHRLRYESGALENPTFKRLSLDVLEGTAQAFEARRSTYGAGPGGPP